MNANAALVVFANLIELKTKVIAPIVDHLNQKAQEVQNADFDPAVHMFFIETSHKLSEIQTSIDKIVDHYEAELDGVQIKEFKG